MLPKSIYMYLFIMHVSSYIFIRIVKINHSISKCVLVKKPIDYSANKYAAMPQIIRLLYSQRYVKDTCVLI